MKKELVPTFKPQLIAKYKGDPKPWIKSIPWQEIEIENELVLKWKK